MTRSDVSPAFAPPTSAASDHRARDTIAEAFAALCVSAGVAIMEVYGRGCGVRIKSDQSPVTEADERAEALIVSELGRQFPGWPVVAEEQCARGGKPPAADRQIFVDPLDGTREFLSRNGEFTVNIGLVEAGLPVAGAVYAPVKGRLWWGGRSAFACDIVPGAALSAARDRRPIQARTPPASGWIALASRSHADADTEAFLERLPIKERRAAGSSLKFCVLAEGEADVYPRFGPTMEWDTAAGDAVLRAAGGIVLGADGAPFRYGKPGYRNGAFVAWGDPATSRLGA